MKEQMKHIGKKVDLKMDGLIVLVKVVDYKFTYGHHRYLVEPVAGKGQKWVELILE